MEPKTTPETPEITAEIKTTEPTTPEVPKASETAPKEQPRDYVKELAAKKSAQAQAKAKAELEELEKQQKELDDMETEDPKVIAAKTSATNREAFDYIPRNLQAQLKRENRLDE
jgi:NACalpha-BTF3-like transcription factor